MNQKGEVAFGGNQVLKEEEVENSFFFWTVEVEDFLLRFTKTRLPEIVIVFLAPCSFAQNQFFFHLIPPQNNLIAPSHLSAAVLGSVLRVMSQPGGG